MEISTEKNTGEDDNQCKNTEGGISDDAMMIGSLISQIENCNKKQNERNFISTEKNMFDEKSTKWTTFESLKKNCARKDSYHEDERMMQRSSAITRAGPLQQDVLKITQMNRMDENKYKYFSENNKNDNTNDFKKMIDEDIKRIKNGMRNCEDKEYNRLILDNIKRMVKKNQGCSNYNVLEMYKLKNKMKNNYKENEKINYKNKIYDQKVIFKEQKFENYKNNLLKNSKNNADGNKMQNNLQSSEEKNLEKKSDRIKNEKLELEKQESIKNVNLRMNEFLQENLPKNDKGKLNYHSIANIKYVNDLNQTDKNYYESFERNKTDYQKQTENSQMNNTNNIYSKNQKIYWPFNEIKKYEALKFIDSSKKNNNYKTSTLDNSLNLEPFKTNQVQNSHNLDYINKTKEFFCQQKMYIEGEKGIISDEKKMFEAALGLIKLSRDLI
ncbi:hypothetical protein COBT_000433 [Conglomerata obtusa]